MHRPWDRKMKRLFKEIPHDLLEWIIPGAQFEGVISTELDGEPVNADHLYDVRLDGQRFLLHVEFQRNRDSRMAERLWEYNVRASLQYDCPVWSCVIYLKKDGSVTKPFLTRTLPDGRVVHRFEFEVIKLWEIPTRELKEKRLVGLLPLLVLTHNGMRRDVVEEAIKGLTPQGEEPQAELLALTYGFASLTFENEEDQTWLIWRFAMLDDILRETRAFQEMAREGREQGLKEGLKEGLKDKLETLRQTLLQIVQARFPHSRLEEYAKEQVARINDPAVLQNLIVKISLSSTLDEAKKLLFDWPSTNNGHN